MRNTGGPAGQRTGDGVGSKKANFMRFAIAALFAFFVFISNGLCAGYTHEGMLLSHLMQSGTAAVVRPPKTLNDPQATDEAKSLMSFLVDQYGQKVLSGQQKLVEIDYIYSITGKQPAVGVFDLIDYSPSRIEHGTNPTGQTESWINWANMGGGIVSLSWHWNAPTDLIDEEGKEWWRGFYTYATTFDIEAVLADPDGEKYQLLIRDLDAIAVELEKFQNAGLPVLWRPLHEASGGWFWWGAQGPGPFIELWQLMYDRYVNVHGLHNLIWVYTAGDSDWYPGDAYVDIVSLDIYPSNPDDSMYWDWWEIQNRYEGVKLVALSESGILPNPDKIRQYGTWWSWFSVWSGDFIRDVDTTFLAAVYDDDDIITLDELIDWKHYLDSENLSCSITWPLNNTKIPENSDVTIYAEVDHVDGTVTKVEFFEGSHKLGEDTSSPYSFTRTNIPRGIYRLSGKVTDDNNLTGDSADVLMVAGNIYPESVRYEAEDAVSDGPTVSTTYSGYSGTGAMLFNAGSGTGLDFTVTSASAGYYPLTIRYLIPSGWNDKNNRIIVNGVVLGSPQFVNTAGLWRDFEFDNVFLNAGANTIRIEHFWGWMYVDYIQLLLPDSRVCPTGDLDLDCDVDLDDLFIMGAGWINPYTLDDMSKLSVDWLK